MGTPGRGIEINGWLIPAPGYEIVSVFAVVDGIQEPRHPLSVDRPDVVADYPSAPSVYCGFSFWCPLGDRDRARIQLVSVLDSGDLVPLLDIHVTVESTVVDPPAGERAISAPDFVIVGTQRGGTTSLHAYLQAHPQIQTPRKKEIHYLTDRYHRGVDWYRGQFPGSVSRNTLVGEATPYALYHPLAPGRLHALAPEARIIILLRNPAERAYSHYLHEHARGHETLTFEDALAAEPERLTGLEAQLASGELAASDMHKRASYADRGRYAQQLERWFQVFPRDQILILLSEDLYAYPAATTRRVTEFLGIPPLQSSAFVTHNASAGPPMRAETRAMLRRSFAPDNARLSHLLGFVPKWE